LHAGGAKGAARLVRSACGSRNVEFVVSGSSNRTGINH
jgi:hypothetical protein